MAHTNDNDNDNDDDNNRTDAHINEPSVEHTLALDAEYSPPSLRSFERVFGKTTYLAHVLTRKRYVSPFSQSTNFSFVLRRNSEMFDGLSSEEIYRMVTTGQYQHNESKEKTEDLPEQHDNESDDDDQIPDLLD